MTPDLTRHADDILEEAINWAVTLSDGFENDAERAEFDYWLTSNPRHRDVWQKLGHDLAPFRSLGHYMSGTTMIDALDRGQTNRRAALRTLGMAALGIGGVTMLSGLDIPLARAADLQTGTAERRRYRLANTALTLDARSRVDLDRDSSRAGIILHEGTIFANVEADSGPIQVRAGPMTVEIGQGDFVISHQRGPTRAIAIDGSARLTMDNAFAWMKQAGDGYAVTDDLLTRLPRNVTANAASWLDGSLVLHDRTLQDLIDALRPYERGLLSISNQAAALRISGVFDLDNLDDTLAMIQSAQPLRIYRLGNLFCHVCLLS